MLLLLYCHTTTLLLPHNTAAIAAQRRCYCRTTPLLLPHNAAATPHNAIAVRFPCALPF